MQLPFQVSLLISPEVHNHLLGPWRCSGPGCFANTIKMRPPLPDRPRPCHWRSGLPLMDGPQPLGEDYWVVIIFAGWTGYFWDGDAGEPFEAGMSQGQI